MGWEECEAQAALRQHARCGAAQRSASESRRSSSSACRLTPCSIAPAPPLGMSDAVLCRRAPMELAAHSTEGPLRDTARAERVLVLLLHHTADLSRVRAAAAPPAAIHTLLSESS